MEDTEIIFAVEESLEGGYTARALGCAIYTPWHRLLGAPVSDNGRLCHAAGGHAGGHRYRRAFMLTCMKRLAVSSRRVTPCIGCTSLLLSDGAVDSGLARFRQPCIRARQGRGALAGA